MDNLLPTQDTPSANATRSLSNLLLFIAALVFAMVVVGGITRLTESGLSITEWKPISGAIPPLTQPTGASVRPLPADARNTAKSRPPRA